MAAYAEVELEFQFQDNTTKKFTLGPFRNNSANLAQLKNKLKQINKGGPQLDPGYPLTDDWAKACMNENGSPLIQPDGSNVYPNVPILNATIVVANETPIDLLS